MSDNPILNSPYDEPRLHYAKTADGSLNYEGVIKGRRTFDPRLENQPTPTRQSKQRSITFSEPSEEAIENHLINLCRKEVGKWRVAKYPETTRVTSELLRFWLENPEREPRYKLFFAQREAVETAIWLNEVAEKSNAGQNILRMIRAAQMSVSRNADEELPRTAFKMATGSGKTVVMACLILYHFANRQEYRNDVRFADYFLAVAPGVTIKDRLGVLFVDTRAQAEHDAEDYYRMRRLVPKSLRERLQNLNSRLVITNYHAFMPKTLQGNKRSPFDGKVDLDGNKVKTDNKEDFSLVLKRVLSDFKTGSRVLILNDEAHHCYLPKGNQKTTDNEEVDENERAAVWFTGLREVAKKYKVHNIYDLSATPYYLSGSGYEPYSLFPWVVSDFGLIEAIESGLVKIPFLPDTDSSQELEQPVLANLYEHVRSELPRKGQRKKKKEAKEEGETLREEKPVIPALIKQALDMFYNHYDEYSKGHREQFEKSRNLFTPPPVFIIVCNNTSVSKEVYKYIAGYEYVDADGEVQVVNGIKPQFDNYDQNKRPKRKPPTLLIDSDALDNTDQINDEFKKVFADEIEMFKRDYARIHGQASAENITDAQILREVVNTVGQQGKLGEHVRCVVSVSMLTEGWDANTVTHIMGIRAFGSQLLCEQVAGRALRRMNYFLESYDKDGNPTTDGRKAVMHKFPPEYAHIIGVPFKLFKGGTAAPVPPPVESHHIKALPERKDEFEITFPNVVGYRIESTAGEITSDFSAVEPYDIDGTRYPVEATLAVAISPREEKLQVKDVLEKRDSELHYLITKELIRYKFSDVEGNPEFRYFGRLKEIVGEWYNDKVRLLGIRGDEYKRLLYFHDPKKVVEHISRGINTHLNTTEFVRPVFNHYNRFGSTKYVSGTTTKAVYETERSHVNFVVEDSGWEAIAAKTLEELNVISYVKNSFLDFRIPYIKDAQEKDYYPDFIIRVNARDGKPKNLILEITGMNKDKAEKKWYVENRWLPAVNSVREKYGYDEWHFIEVRDDIRDVKNVLIDAINSI
ncbi:MAG: BPTD_3080 family restriction endonuclease [Pyrinomonadaceae bacterium]